jgi:hypothetical protein
MRDTPAAIARNQSGWDTPLPLPGPKQNCCNSTTANSRVSSPALSLRDSGSRKQRRDGRAGADGGGWTRRQITTTAQDLQVSTVKAFVAATVARRDGPREKRTVRNALTAGWRRRSLLNACDLPKPRTASVGTDVPVSSPGPFG